MKHLIIAVLLLVSGVFIAEGVLSIYLPPTPPVVTTRTTEDLQAMLVPSATTHHELQRLTSYQLSDGSELQINSLGLRGPEPETIASGDRIRILFLGDETVLCPDQPDEHTLTHRLKQFLEKATGREVEVINAGVPGYSPLLSWIQFRQQLTSLAPDIVIVHFDMNDIDDDRVYRRFLQVAGENQICPHADLQSKQQTGHPLIHSLKNSGLARYVASKTGIQSIPVSNPSERHAWTIDNRSDLRLMIQHALRPLESFQQHAAATGYKLLVSTAPVPWQVTTSDDFPQLKKSLDDQSMWPVKNDRPFQILAAACEQQMIIFSDSTADFRGFSQPAKLYQSGSRRLSAYGNALYARSISATLLETPDLAAVFSSRNRISAQTTGLH